MPRNYYRCPCGWQIAWAFTATPSSLLPNPSFLDDSDPGLLIALHVRKLHPDWIEEIPTLTLESILTRMLVSS